MKQLLFFLFTILIYSCGDTGTTPGDNPKIKDIGISKEKYIIPFYDTDVYLICHVKYYINNYLIKEKKLDTILYKNLKLNDGKYESSILDYKGYLTAPFQIELTYELSTGKLTSMGQEFSFAWTSNLVNYLCNDSFGRIRLEGTTELQKIVVIKYTKYELSGDINRFEIYVFDRIKV